MLYIPQFNLQRLNTLAVPACAAYYVKVTDQEQLLKAIGFAKAHQLPLLPLGGGSNIVLKEDFPGLVIHIALKGYEVIEETESTVKIKVAAGEIWNDFVNCCVEQGLGGVENLALIPGTVGAAPIQNIGAYGVEVEQAIDELTAIEIASGLPVTFNRDACQFGYRESIFKSALKNKYIITGVVFSLTKQPVLTLNYPALTTILQGINDITIRDVRDAVVKVRSEKLPDPADIPNAGSFFKNPVVSYHEFEVLLKAYPDIVYYLTDDGRVKLAAGWLIEKAGWKGQTFDGVSVHQKQALVLTNPCCKSGASILSLAAKIADDILSMFGVVLEVEPNIIP